MSAYRDPVVEERKRQASLPAYMRASLNPEMPYPEEFRVSITGIKTPADMASHRDLGEIVTVKVAKGHSPHDGTPYYYVVQFGLEPNKGLRETRYCPIAIYREDNRPRRWVNQKGEGFKPAPTDGMRLSWFVATKSRSERTNSIIAKAKHVLWTNCPDDQPEVATA